MLVAGGFNHGWNYIVNRLMTSVDYLEYHLAGFIAIQTIIFVVINKPGIHNLQGRRIGESGTKLLNSSRRHRSRWLLGTVITGVVLTLEIIETVITPIVGIEYLGIIGYRSIAIIINLILSIIGRSVVSRIRWITTRASRIIGASLYSILLISCFTVSLSLISLTSNDSTNNSSASHTDDGSHIRASRSTG